ncbi:hypothetical protein ALC57_10080 [Trachymyrmex cornetzi]|uniref:Uncharacterized protein n=1 Tax=Trachymyrmex cornetzi TaxID=471704 RepID=A0A195DY14_9HYME|nr:hypothetical protein ALC57_10080 [Trachymyrmex cornetzi]
MAAPEMPCTYEFSKGYGTGVAEALGNWGFSNRTCSAGQERSDKPVMCVKYDRRYDPEAWYVKPSPDECKPAWTFPIKRPLITYCSTATIMKVSNMREIRPDFMFVIPGRSYVQQGTTKWYRRGSNCCCQPSCLAPQCPVRYSCES